MKLLDESRTTQPTPPPFPVSLCQAASTYCILTPQTQELANEQVSN
uniref:Uncharacterized protein n=1 Tax=Populus trichocarpa TaxID=3694 RepID=A0A3N7GZM0_POPTR